MSFLVSFLLPPVTGLRSSLNSVYLDVVHEAFKMQSGTLQNFYVWRRNLRISYRSFCFFFTFLLVCVCCVRAFDVWTTERPSYLCSCWRRLASFSLSFSILPRLMAQNLRNTLHRLACGLHRRWSGAVLRPSVPDDYRYVYHDGSSRKFDSSFIHWPPGLAHYSFITHFGYFPARSVLNALVNLPVHSAPRFSDSSHTLSTCFSFSLGFVVVSDRHCFRSACASSLLCYARHWLSF